MRLVVLAAMLALAAAPAGAVPPPAGSSGFDGAGPYRLYDDWLVVCDNVATCMAASAETEGRAVLRIARTGDWDALPDPLADLSSAGFDGNAVILVLQPQGSLPHATPGRRARTRLTMHRLAAGWFGMGDVEIAAFLAAARTADSARFETPDGRVLAQVSLRGLVAAMDRIDHVQTRTGTITATYNRGGILVPLAAIMPPPAPVVEPVEGVPDRQARALQTRAFLMICGTGLARSPGDAVAWRMASGHHIVAVDCRIGGLNGGRIWLVEDPAGALDLARLPVPDLPGAQDLTGFLANSWFDHITGRLHALELGRPAGDCGSRLSWQWTTGGFRLAEAQRMPLCTGIAQALWPGTWSTRLP